MHLTATLKINIEITTITIKLENVHRNRTHPCNFISISIFWSLSLFLLLSLSLFYFSSYVPATIWPLWNLLSLFLQLPHSTNNIILSSKYFFNQAAAFMSAEVNRNTDQQMTECCISSVRGLNLRKMFMFIYCFST